LQETELEQMIRVLPPFTLPLSRKARREFVRKVWLALLFMALSPVLTAQQSLNNDAVIKLANAGLSDDLIVSTVNASSGKYDTSADGLVALKKAGVSEKVVAAVVAKASDNATASPASIPPLSAPPVVDQTTAGQAPPLSATVEKSTGEPRIFVKAEPDFAVALTAALNKKHAPATIVLDVNRADYVLQSAAVNSKEESGVSKIARCMFAYCIGIEGKSSVSVQLVRVGDSSVVWAYQVRKGNSGTVGTQSLSEAIAKHLKSEFLDRKK
jgi:hypothetical protein